MISPSTRPTQVRPGPLGTASTRAQTKAALRLVWPSNSLRQLAHAILVRGLGSGPPGGMHPRVAPQVIHSQAGIVGQGRKSQYTGVKSRLDIGIVLKGIGVFHRLGRGAKIAPAP